MSTQTTVRKGTSKDVYGIITDKVIEQLEKGIIPWRKTWAAAGVPAALVSRKPYRGINFLLLACLGYERNYFLTSKQLKDLGGSILPDEKPHMVVFRNYAERDSEVQDEEPGKEKPSFLRYYTVYNVAQCTGIPEEALQGIVWSPVTIPTCVKILAEMPHCPPIRHKEPGTYYDPLVDVINMPKKNTFTSELDYYASLFHQLVHSTGHHTRLDRMGLVQMSEYGCASYTQEELVTEIGTCYLQSLAGITISPETDAAYAKEWVKKLKEDRFFLFTASTLAQKAIDFILNLKVEETNIA